jgi:hypothetical protein
LIAEYTLTTLLERIAQPGVLGAPGKRVERACASDLATYFRTLGAKIAAMEWSGVVKQDAEHARSAAELLVNGVIRNASPALLAILSTNIYDAMMVADKAEYLKEDDTGNTIDRVGLSAQDAANYAATKGASLVTGMNATTRTILGDTVADSILTLNGVDGLKRDLLSVFEDMASWRAEMIATTEMNDAMSEAAMNKMARLNIEYKQVILSPEACPICEDNAAEDPLPINQSYSSGDLRPPFHPNCRCAVVGARPPQIEEGAAA